MRLVDMVVERVYGDLQLPLEEPPGIDDVIRKSLGAKAVTWGREARFRYVSRSRDWTITVPEDLAQDELRWEIAKQFAGIVCEVMAPCPLIVEELAAALLLPTPCVERVRWIDGQGLEQIARDFGLPGHVVERRVLDLAGHRKSGPIALMKIVPAAPPKSLTA